MVCHVFGVARRQAHDVFSTHAHRTAICATPKRKADACVQAPASGTSTRRCLYERCRNLTDHPGYPIRRRQRTRERGKIRSLPRHSHLLMPGSSAGTTSPTVYKRSRSAGSQRHPPRSGRVVQAEQAPGTATASTPRHCTSTTSSSLQSRRSCVSPSRAWCFK